MTSHMSGFPPVPTVLVGMCPRSAVLRTERAGGGTAVDPSNNRSESTFDWSL